MQRPGKSKLGEILTVEMPGRDSSVPNTGILCKKLSATGIKPLQQNTIRIMITIIKYNQIYMLTTLICDSCSIKKPNICLENI